MGVADVDGGLRGCEEGAEEVGVDSVAEFAREGGEVAGRGRGRGRRMDGGAGGGHCWFSGGIVGLAIVDGL